MRDAAGVVISRMTLRNDRRVCLHLGSPNSPSHAMQRRRACIWRRRSTTTAWPMASSGSLREGGSEKVGMRDENQASDEPRVILSC